MQGVRYAGLVILALVVALVRPAGAFHTAFQYRVDRFELDGNTAGAFDGVPDVVDEFDAPPLGPLWVGTFGTFAESDGYLVLSNPGGHYPAADGGTLDMSVAGSGSPAIMTKGSGNFTGTAYWEGVVPALHHHYYFALFNFGGVIDGYDADVVGIAIRRTDDAVQIEQHAFELARFTGAYRNTRFWFHDIDPGDVTGRIVFRLQVNDAASTVTTAFSLDGGSTWQSPFPGQPFFQTRASAQFILGADPSADPIVGTTTTTMVGTTTTTTLTPFRCTLDGCRRSLGPFEGKLMLSNGYYNGYPLKVRWKWAAGAATTLEDFGDPNVDHAEFCLGNASGAMVGGTVGFYPPWQLTATGYKWAGQFSGHSKDQVKLRAGTDGETSVLLKSTAGWMAEGFWTSPSLTLPIVARFSLPNGTCFAEYFGPAGVKTNVHNKFVGKPGSPGAAFVDDEAG